MIVRVETVTAEVVSADVDIRTACHIVGRVRMGTRVEPVRVAQCPAAIKRIDVPKSEQLMAHRSYVLRLEDIAFRKFPLESKMRLLVVRSYNVLVHMPRVGKGIEQRIVVLSYRRKRECN